MGVSILEQSVIYQGWGRYLLLKLALPDGAVVERQLDDHGSAAAVLAYDPERRMALLARLARAGVLFTGQDPYLIEACAGRIDPGETAEECARREAMEELGVRLSALEPVAEAFSSPGVCTEHLGLFLAAYGLADRVAEGGGAAGEHEGIEVLELPLAEVWRMTESGAIADMKTLLLTYALRMRHPHLF